jgi:predicted nucleic acid-binding protein
MLSAVLDANVIIGLAKGGLFPLLRSIYTPIFVPEAVVAEVIQPGTPLDGALELSLALHDWVIPVTPAMSAPISASSSLSFADLEAIAAVLENAASHLLTGDERLRRAAADHGIICLGTTEITVLLKMYGLVSEVKPVLDQMRSRGFGIDDTLYHQALAAAGE